MIDKDIGFKAVLLLTFSGFLSGLLTVFIYAITHFSTWFWLGLPFGLLISGCLAGLGIIDDFSRVVRLVFVAFVAHLLSFLVAWFLGTFLSGASLSGVNYDQLGISIALFVGGTIGACLILMQAVFLPRVDPKARGKLDLAFKPALLWSPVGGALAAVGWALRSTLGTALLSFAHALRLASLTDLRPDETHLLFSVYVVWQTGMALMLGLMFLGYEAKFSPKKLEQP